MTLKNPLLGFIGETEVRIQIKAPNSPFNAGASSFLEVKNCDIDNFIMCAKISLALNSKFKIFTTPPKYVPRPLLSAAVVGVRNFGVQG